MRAHCRQPLLTEVSLSFCSEWSRHQRNILRARKPSRLMLVGTILVPCYLITVTPKPEPGSCEKARSHEKGWEREHQATSSQRAWFGSRLQHGTKSFMPLSPPFSAKSRAAAPGLHSQGTAPLLQAYSWGMPNRDLVKAVQYMGRTPLSCEFGSQ